MNRQSLALSFSDSLTEEVSGCVGEFVEIGIDSALEDGLLKDIPFISTAVSIYQIGKTIRERYHLKKLAAFIDEINKGTADETERMKYREKIQEDKERCSQELEYLIILIDRYISADKARVLAKLYLTYLRGGINWAELCLFSDALDRLLGEDIAFLQSSCCKYSPVHISRDDIVGRLGAVGFLILDVRESGISTHFGAARTTSVSGYVLTAAGQKLRSVLINQK